MQLAPFDPTKKKKKKKVLVQDPADEAVDKVAEKTENLSGKFFYFLFSFFLKILTCLVNLDNKD